MSNTMTVDHRGNATLYFTPWRHHSGAVEVRRIISISRNTRPTPLRTGTVVTWTVVAVEHYSNGERGRILADADHDTYGPALDALWGAMAHAVADGYAVKTDLARLPRRLRPLS